MYNYCLKCLCVLFQQIPELFYLQLTTKATKACTKDTKDFFVPFVQTFVCGLKCGKVIVVNETITLFLYQTLKIPGSKTCTVHGRL
jgi:hypothetical protein